MVSVNLDGDIEPADHRRLQKLVVKEHNGDVVRLGGYRRTSSWAPRTTSRTCASTGKGAHVHGRVGAANGERARRDPRVRWRCRASRPSSRPE